MPTQNRLLAVPFALAVLIGACGGTAPPAGSGGPSVSDGPATPPPAGTIAYPSGATDVVLRFSEGGGFMPAEFHVTNGPIFTLYGDRTVVFRDVTMAPPSETDAIRRNVPYRTASLSEEQVQELLDFVLNRHGLGVARERYDNPLVADAPTATFEIHVSGLDKTVDVVALGMDDGSAPDAVMRAELARVAERLKRFDQGGAAAPYEPTSYEGYLLEAGPVEGVEFRDWPFADIAPEDFVTPLNDPGRPSVPARVFTPAEIAALGIDGLEGGATGIYVMGPDRAPYALALRPLLPDERR